VLSTGEPQAFAGALHGAEFDAQFSAYRAALGRAKQGNERG
jgi:hypothetical protein